jgi:hypothetical protein
MPAQILGCGKYAVETCRAVRSAVIGDGNKQMRELEDPQFAGLISMRLQ